MASSRSATSAEDLGKLEAAIECAKAIDTITASAPSAPIASVTGLNANAMRMWINSIQITDREFEEDMKSVIEKLGEYKSGLPSSAQVIQTSLRKKRRERCGESCHSALIILCVLCDLVAGFRQCSERAWSSEFNC